MKNIKKSEVLDEICGGDNLDVSQLLEQELGDIPKP